MQHETCILAIALTLFIPERALAQSEDVLTQSDHEFRLGREATTRGDYRLALHLFRASQELDPGRGKLLNIALCEEKLGLVTAATQHFQQVLSLFAPEDERRALVQQHLAELGPRGSHLRVVLGTAAPAGTRVTFDGALLAAPTLGTEMAINPGKHTVVVNATGLPERRYDVVLEEGKALTLTVEPGVIVPPKPVPRGDATPPTSRRKQVGVILGGTGLITLTTGGVTGILALVDLSAIDKQCPTHLGCSPDVLHRASSGESLSIVSALALSAGAIGVSAGMYLVLSSGKSMASTTVGLTVLPDGGRLGARWAF